MALISATRWSWQCEPIRLALQVTNKGAEQRVGPKYSKEPDEGPLFPWEVERRDGEHWVPVRPAKNARVHPARHLTSPAGRKFAKDTSFTFEADLWQLDVLSTPGTIRVRFLFESRDPITKTSADLPTPWLEIEVRAHAGNAAHLLGDAALGRRTAYDDMSRSLNWTITTSRNVGPYNPGPGGFPFHGWERHSPLAAGLIADAAVSWKLRARAKLVLAGAEIANAHRTNATAADAHLRAATELLTAEELTTPPPAGGFDALPSGGLEAMRQLLLGYLDTCAGRREPKAVRADLSERSPFFAMWWQMELIQVLR